MAISLRQGGAHHPPEDPGGDIGHQADGAESLHTGRGEHRRDCVETASNKPDRFIDQDTPRAMYEAAGLNASHIAATALGALGLNVDVQAFCLLPRAVPA